jgi:hypothetical protein
MKSPKYQVRVNRWSDDYSPQKMSRNLCCDSCNMPDSRLDLQRRGVALIQLNGSALEMDDCMIIVSY